MSDDALRERIISEFPPEPNFANPAPWVRWVLAHRAEAAAEERAAIVAWLYDKGMNHHSLVHDMLAEAIEGGEHHAD